MYESIDLAADLEAHVAAKAATGDRPGPRANGGALDDRQVHARRVRLELRELIVDRQSGDFEPTKMCARGLRPKSPSRVPAGTTTTSGRCESPGTFDPQRPQNARSNESVER